MRLLTHNAWLWINELGTTVGANYVSRWSYISGNQLYNHELSLLKSRVDDGNALIIPPRRRISLPAIYYREDYSYY